jgi:hypothetical protein
MKPENYAEAKAIRKQNPKMLWDSCYLLACEQITVQALEAWLLSFSEIEKSSISEAIRVSELHTVAEVIRGIFPHKLQYASMADLSAMLEKHRPFGDVSPAGPRKAKASKAKASKADPLSVEDMLNAYILNMRG